MKETSGKCHRCNGHIGPDGFCPACNSYVSETPLIEQEPEIRELKLPSAQQAKAKPAGSKAHLFDRHTQMRHELINSVVRIGRDENNDIPLEHDSYVSRHHAWIIFSKGHWWVEDLGSTNGTLLNGAFVNGRQRIQPGDLLKIGKSELEFEAG